MIKKKIQGVDLKAHLAARAKDRLHHFMLAGGTIRGAVLHGTLMVREMQANHGLGLLETYVLGHAYLGAGLMTAGLKGEDRIALQIDCNGPIKGLTVQANAFGEVRGYLKQNPIAVQAPLERFDLAPFFGAGLLTVTRHLKSAKQPFEGRVDLRYGNLAQDLAYYYVTSEQIPTAFDLSIHFDGDGKPVGAGGLLLQAMPDASPETVAGLETLVQSLPCLGRAFCDASDLQQFVATAFAQYSPNFVGDRRIEFMCHCNAERIGDMFLVLPREELSDIMTNGPFPVEVRCHHCNTLYRVNQQTLQKIYTQRFATPQAK